jgi:hypothetical protein
MSMRPYHGMNGLTTMFAVKKNSCLLRFERSYMHKKSRMLPHRKDASIQGKKASDAGLPQSDGAAPEEKSAAPMQDRRRFGSFCTKQTSGDENSGDQIAPAN